MSYFDHTDTGYLIARINEVNSIGSLFSITVNGLVIGFLETLFTIFVMFTMNVYLTIVVLIFLPFMVGVVQLSAGSIRRVSKQVLEQNALVSRDMQRALSGVTLIKTAGTEGREVKAIHEQMTRATRASIKQSVRFGMSGEAMTLLTSLAGVAVLGVAAFLMMNHMFMLGSYVAFTAYVTRLSVNVGLTAGVGFTVQPALSALQRAGELEELTTEEDSQRTVSVRHLDGDIAFEQVSFAYGNEGKLVLRNVSFRVKPGEHVVITGPNGAGKSTILKLLLALYTPQKGVIRIDGIDLNHIRLMDLRMRLGLVGQTSVVFNDTIRNNILYVAPNASPGLFEEVLQVAGIDQFAQQLPLGLETKIGEQGVRLSGGQIQRISIARTLLSEPDVLLLDEPTKFLDEDGAKNFLSFIQRRYKGKTCIMVTHNRQESEGWDAVWEIRNGELSRLWKPEIQSKT